MILLAFSIVPCLWEKLDRDFTNVNDIMRFFYLIIYIVA
jgi:hypothetical protein